MVSDSHQGGTSSAEDRVTCHRPDSLKSMHRCFSTRLMVTEEWLHHTTLACSIYVFFFFFLNQKLVKQASMAKTFFHIFTKDL